MNHNFNEVEMLCWLAGGLSFQDEGLGEEQPGDAKQRQHQQQALDPKLTGVHVLLTLRAVLLVFLPKDQIVQESSFYNPSIMLKTHLEEDHVDKCDENRRGAALSRQVAVLTLKAAGHKAGPLVEHEEAHVAKHAGHEDDLRHKLAEDIGLVVEVLVIPQGQDDAEEHVNDAEDDGDFHLEGVQEDDLVGGHLPDGVDAEGVGRAVVAAAGQIAAVGRVDHDRLLVQYLPGRHSHLPGGPDNKISVLFSSR